LLNDVAIARMINEKQLYDDLVKLQIQYNKSFKIEEEICLSEHLDMDLMRKSIKRIKAIVQSQRATIYYHGSKTPGIQTLYPNLSIHGEKYVYLTTKKEVALMYTVNAIESFFEKHNLVKPNQFHPWFPYGFKHGILQINEYYPNAFEETYKGKSGYLYTCSEPLHDISNQTNIFCAITTKEKIEVLKETFIEDIYAELLELESKGLIMIKRYKDWTDKQLKGIEQSILDEIERLDLLNQPDHHYTIFLRHKFPNLFKSTSVKRKM